MTSEPGYQTVAIHILPNISRSKGNQTIQFVQLVEYMRNMFLEKSYTKSGGETIPRPYSKKSKLIIYLDQYSKVLKLSCKPLVFMAYKALSENKKGLEPLSLPHF